MNGLRIAQLESKTGLKKTKIYALIKARKLPHPIKVGKASVWLEAEVDQALAKMAKERDRVLQRKTA